MSVPGLWRTRHERYSLQGKICPNCSKVIFPPRSACINCNERQNVNGIGVAHKESREFVTQQQQSSLQASQE